nr:unnamed protein product [Digitaria exilis]
MLQLTLGQLHAELRPPPVPESRIPRPPIRHGRKLDFRLPWLRLCVPLPLGLQIHTRAPEYSSLDARAELRRGRRGSAAPREGLATRPGCSDESQSRRKKEIVRLGEKIGPAKR